MSEVKLNPVFDGFHKKLGNIVFYKKNGKTLTRRLPEHSGQKSEKQEIIRTAFMGTVNTWKNLPELLKTSWTSFAKKSKRSGYLAFMTENAARFRKAEALLISAGTGIAPLKNLNAAAGNAGEIALSFTMPEGITYGTVHFILQKFSEEKLTPELIFSEMPAIPDAHSIKGLASGKYAVYAFLSQTSPDLEILTSSSISATVTAA